ncbi:hypothetical protein B0H13DRAFT_2536213 [Mycena leptocephala]|nr:hypothetical protein B0H13DRAFT_2536213 [Mycena leptocephala]
MPFPELGGVATTKGEETAVLKLNEHQQSWILDIGVRSIDLPSLRGKAAKTFYEKVKTDAFDAKAFQHTPQPTDRVEEARLPALVAAWKEKKPSKKKNNSAADDDDASDEEEDEGGWRGLLRADTPRRGGDSNKRTAENNKRKTKNDDTSPIAETPALSKLLGFEWWSRVEAVPKDICVRQTFEKQTPQLVKDSLNAMYAWAEKPLKDYVATLEDSTNAAPQVFPLSTEGLDDVSPKALAQTVTNFLVDSHQAAFGTRDIPWAAVASMPKEYYDADITFTLTGLVQLTVTQWYELAATLASVAGAGTSGFFRKALAGQDDEEEDRADEDARRADEAKAEAARLADKAKVEAARLVDEAARVADEAKAEVAHLAEDANIVPLPLPPSPPPRKGTGGRKRKAESQLVPEDDAPESAGPTRRTTRTRLTPQEAALERQKRLAAEVTINGAKPRYHFSLSMNFRICLGPEESGQTQAKLYEQNLSCAATEDPVELELRWHSSPSCNEENSIFATRRAKVDRSTVMKKQGLGVEHKVSRGCWQKRDRGDENIQTPDMIIQVGCIDNVDIVGALPAKYSCWSSTMKWVFHFTTGTLAARAPVVEYVRREWQTAVVSPTKKQTIMVLLATDSEATIALWKDEHQPLNWVLAATTISVTLAIAGFGFTREASTCVPIFRELILTNA